MSTSGAAAFCGVSEVGCWRRKYGGLAVVRVAGRGRVVVCAAAKTSIDVTVLSALSAEVREKVVPSRVEVVSQRDSSKIALCLRTEEGRSWLDLSWRLGTGRVCLTSHSPPRGKKEEEKVFALGNLLRSSIVGSAMTDCRLAAPLERIVRLDFSERIGTEPFLSLYLELLGSGKNNLIVVDPSTMDIKACGRQVSGKRAQRSLQTGGTYSLPPEPSSAIASPEESREDFIGRIRSLSGEKLARALVRTYRGMSPAMASFLLSHAQIHLDSLVEVVPNDELDKVYELFIQWTRAVSSTDEYLFKPRLSADGSVDALGLGEDESSKKICELIDNYSFREDNAAEIKRLKEACSRRLEAALGRWNGKVELFLSQSEGEEEADQLREEGDMIMAFAHTWNVGDKTVTVETLSGSTEVYKVPEGETAVSVAQMRHKLSQKKRRAIEKVQPLLEEAKRKVEYYETMQYEVESLDVEQLNLLQELFEDIESSVLADKSAQKKKSTPALANKRKKASKEALKELTCVRIPKSETAVVYVGRNTRQNELITFDVGRKDDLWFHAAGVPGGHIVLHVEDGDTIGEEDIQAAADLAAYFSRGRNQGSQSVIYTRLKNVRRAGAPGLVTFDKEKFISGRPDYGHNLLQSLDS